MSDKKLNKKTFIANIKNHTCYYFYEIIKIEGFDKLLVDEKSYKHILVYNISLKILIGAKPMRIRLDKRYRYLVLKNSIPFTIEIDALLVKKSGFTYPISYNYVKFKVIYTILFAS